jgi:glutathione S-transferase
MMKLICHPISPYARKAMILARLHKIELQEVLPEKDGENGYLAGDNPLGKIPSLEWRPGQYLFDSPVICDYLDSLAERPLLPIKGQKRHIYMWQHALGDGLADAVYNYRYETVRPKELHWPEIIKRHETAIIRSIETLERICEWLEEPWTYGNVAIITALDYASFRAAHLNWQGQAPKLNAWHKVFTSDPAYIDTYGYDNA